MTQSDRESLMRMAAFKHVRGLQEIHGYLTRHELKSGFFFEDKRIPLTNPQRGIFKPRQMQFLLSIKTVFPSPKGKIWYDDQREVYSQILEGADSVDYSFMGSNPEAADNRWLREALENRIPVIYFLGIAPGCYQALLPVFISEWNPKLLKARVVFGTSSKETGGGQIIEAFPENTIERRYALHVVRSRLHQASFRQAIITGL